VNEENEEKENEKKKWKEKVQKYAARQKLRESAWKLFC